MTTIPNNHLDDTGLVGNSKENQPKLEGYEPPEEANYDLAGPRKTNYARPCFQVARFLTSCKGVKLAYACT